MRAVAPEATIYVLSGLRWPGAAAVRASTASCGAQLGARHRDLGGRGLAGRAAAPGGAACRHRHELAGHDAGGSRAFRERERADRAVEIALLSATSPARTSRAILNVRQLEVFRQARSLFPGVEASLAASSGVLLGGDYLCELTRPGIELYGGMTGGAAFAPRTVVTAQARVLQARAARGEAAATARQCGSYATASWRSPARAMRTPPRGQPPAPRALRARRTRRRHGLHPRQRVPVVGRISMDLDHLRRHRARRGRGRARRHDRTVRPEHPDRRGRTRAGTIPLRAADRAQPPVPPGSCPGRSPWLPRVQFICQSCGTRTRWAASATPAASGTRWSRKARPAASAPGRTRSRARARARRGAHLARRRHRGRAAHRLGHRRARPGDRRRLRARLGAAGFGGDPGIGKSTLLTQAAAALANQGHRIVYVSGEEAVAQIRLRAQRLGVAQSVSRARRRDQRRGHPPRSPTASGRTS